MRLSPWKNPNLLQIPFQIGMFSFWGTVAFAPRILLTFFLLNGFHTAYVLALRQAAGSVEPEPPHAAV
jgi:hypothetical protein